jgi:hypothetical protein
VLAGSRIRQIWRRTGSDRFNRERNRQIRRGAESHRIGGEQDPVRVVGAGSVAVGSRVRGGGE